MDTVVHGETGLIVPAGSPQALADALVRLAADPAERARLGANGDARYEGLFSASQMAERTVALYERSISRPTGLSRRRPHLRPA